MPKPDDRPSRRFSLGRLVPIAVLSAGLSLFFAFDLHHYVTLETLKTHPATVVFVSHNLRESIMLAEGIALVSAAPMRVLQVVDVPLTLPQRFDEDAIETFRRDLAARELPGLRLAS